MKRLLSIIAEVIDEITSAYKYAEYDFYKLVTEVTSLLQQASSRGYKDPDACSLTIKVVNKLLTTVVIDSYYKKSNGKYQKFSKKLDIGTLSNVPTNVRKRLDVEKELTIRLSDLDSFKSVRQDEIIPSVLFSNLYNFKLKDVTETPQKKELHITDNLFYYKVVFVYKYDNGVTNTKVKFFGHIEELPSEINEKILSNDDRSCFLDVTNP